MTLYTDQERISIVSSFEMGREKEESEETHEKIREISVVARCFVPKLPFGNHVLHFGVPVELGSQSLVVDEKTDRVGEEELPG